MAQLNVKVDPSRLEALKRYASRRRTPVAWLIKDYVDYLLAGGDPVSVPEADPDVDSRALVVLAQAGRAFDWLEDEPDIYSESDGEPV